MPEFHHLRAEQILVVSGEARRASRATVRPMRFPGGRLEQAARPGRGRQRRPKVTFRGHEILYVITLRPLFFRASTLEERVETILHELFHLPVRFDGTLDEARRHSVMGRSFGAALRPLVRRYLAACPASLLTPFAINGEVLVRQWLERPVKSFAESESVRQRFSEAQTFLGPVRMITRSTRH